ncbi:hypothetical protein [Streptomyces sp. NBC_01538]|uniref:hypothetical protein n=1 Tax=Streptomyces sp. NBC_01538 TaxID=2903897 RepID=UPI00386D8CC2
MTSPRKACVTIAAASSRSRSRTKAFAAAFRARHDSAPTPWAAESCDAVRFTAHGLTANRDDGRSTLRLQLLRSPWQGITRRISFDATSKYFQVEEDSRGSCTACPRVPLGSLPAPTTSASRGRVNSRGDIHP